MQSSLIIGQQLNIDQLNRRLEAAQKMEDEEEAEMRRADKQHGCTDEGR